MKVAYILLSPVQGIHHLANRILPQLESGQHALDVVALCFFDENAFVLEREHPISHRLEKVTREKNILLLMAKKSDMERKVKSLTDGYLMRLRPTECAVTMVCGHEQIACFPDLYAALGEANRPDHILCL
ncbi:MAG: hypothetical protein WKF66_09785 [Pedobacter sp.]